MTLPQERERGRFGYAKAERGRENRTSCVLGKEVVSVVKSKVSHGEGMRMRERSGDDGK